MTVAGETVKSSGQNALLLWGRCKLGFSRGKGCEKKGCHSYMEDLLVACRQCGEGTVGMCGLNAHSFAVATISAAVATGVVL